MKTKEAILELIKEVLDGTELSLEVDKLSLEEDLESGRANVAYEVHHTRTGEKKRIEGTGVGMIDAAFHGIVTLYSDEYPSLTTIRFSDFAVKADLETGNNALTDSTATVTLRVANSLDREYAFTDASPSLTRSSLNVVVQAAEFFINSERAFIQVHRALQHAREQNRPDSVGRYTQQLTTLVEATSYTEVIEQMKKDL